MGGSVSKSQLTTAEVCLGKLAGGHPLPAEDPFWLELFSSFQQPLSKYDPTVVDDVLIAFIPGIGKTRPIGGEAPLRLT